MVVSVRVFPPSLVNHKICGDRSWSYSSCDVSAFSAPFPPYQGLYHSLSRYCASERGGRNMIALKDIVPTTFYLTGGAALDNKNDDENDNDSPWTSGTPISGVGEDHRREFLAYCCALDARATIPPTIDASAASASPQSPNATPHTPRDTHGSELERETPLDDDPHGNELERHAPLDDDTHGIQIERPPSPPPQPSRDMDEMAEVENVRPRKESKGQLVRRTLLSGTLFGEGRQGGGAAGVATREEEIGAGGVGVPTWVVKPAANSNCGFGIQVCCSPQVGFGIFRKASHVRRLVNRSDGSARWPVSNRN